MAKGVSTPPERKLAALAELEAGACTPEQVAEKYCVTTITLRTWQRTFEEGGSLEDAPSGQRARKLAQQQRLGELKGRRIRREPRDTDRQITVWREAPKPPSAPVEVVLPEPTRAPEPIQNDMPTVPQLLAEIDRLKNENARLKTKLRQALAMVIDED